jgi:hypothetical protein
VRAAKLQGNRMLSLRISKKPLAIAVDHGIGGHHLSIKERVPAQLTVKDAAMPVSPVHHGGNTETVAELGHTKSLCTEIFSFRLVVDERRRANGAINAPLSP